MCICLVLTDRRTIFFHTSSTHHTLILQTFILMMILLAVFLTFIHPINKFSIVNDFHLLWSNKVWLIASLLLFCFTRWLSSAASSSLGTENLCATWWTTSDLLSSSRVVGSGLPLNKHAFLQVSRCLMNVLFEMFSTHATSLVSLWIVLHSPLEKLPEQF